MHPATSIVTNHLKKIATKMHAKRFDALRDCIVAQIKRDGGTLSAIGRAISRTAKPKHRIKCFEGAIKKLCPP